MLTINPQTVSVPVMQRYLQGAVSPRPIAFASTIDGDGQVNLSPFSFFNVFGSNPPILVFSPARRGRDNTVKHTFENVSQVPEVVIHIVNYALVQQASLSSTEYPRGINEFIKAGLTPVDSIKVKPPRVQEAPVAMECIVKQIIPLGDQGGAGNLVVCEVVLMHIAEGILDEHQQIDPYKLDAVARMGENWYCRAQGAAIFAVPKPLQQLGIGVDKIPEPIRLSTVLTGNDLGMLGNIQQLPDAVQVALFREQTSMKQALAQGDEAVHKLAQEFLKKEEIENAWLVLLARYGYAVPVL